MTYEIVLTEGADGELSAIRKFDQAKIRKAIDLHLTHEPKRESRSRIKKLIQPAISEFRLRVGEFRVYYDVVDDDHRVVILHVHKKGTGRTPQEGGL